MKTLLYATNYSKYAANELRYAYALSKQMDAALVVLHVFDDIKLSDAIIHLRLEQLHEETLNEQMNVLIEFCSKVLGGELEKMNVRPRVIKNEHTANGILQIAKEVFADMIIVGMKSDDSRRGFFAGNITQALVKKSNAPVLALPNTLNECIPQTIVYATDYEEEDIYAIKEIIPLAEAFNCKIHIIHISTSGEYAVKDHMEWFKEMLFQKVTYKDIAFEIVFSEFIAERLDAYLHKVNADILVMLERKESSLLKQIFHKDLVKKMETKLKIPLLSFNEVNL